VTKRANHQFTSEIRNGRSSHAKSPSRDSSEAGLADRVDGGQTIHVEATLSLIFRTQYQPLLRFCRVRIRSKADAEDIVQSAFLAARRAYPDKKADELRPLLFTLVRNMAISHLKLHWNRHRHGEDISDVGKVYACPQSPTPETQLIAAESLIVVEEALAGMTPRRREALRLHRYEGLSYEEIARRLSVSSAAVKKHVALAVAEIARRLAEAEGGDG